MGIMIDLKNLTEANKLNVAKVPLDKARAYAKAEFERVGKELEKEIPDFDDNYRALQKAMKSAVDIPRIDMPVIEPTDMDRFENDIIKGRIDIFKPSVQGRISFPTDLKAGSKEAQDFLTLGIQDGNPKDDRLKAKIKRMPASKLLPTQSQIWLEKIIGNIVKFGLPTKGSSISESTMITSREGHILDGHHRFGQAMIGNPSLGMRVLHVPLDIDTLLKMGRSYGNAIGNKQKQ